MLRPKLMSLDGDARRRDDVATRPRPNLRLATASDRPGPSPQRAFRLILAQGGQYDAPLAGRRRKLRLFGAAQAAAPAG